MKKYIVLSICIILIFTFVFIYTKAENQTIKVYFDEQTFEVKNLDDIDLNTSISEKKEFIKNKINSDFKASNIEINHKFIEDNKNEYHIEINGDFNIENKVLKNNDLEISEYKFIVSELEKVTFNFDKKIVYDLSDISHFEIGTINNDQIIDDYSIAANQESITAVINKKRRLSQDYIPKNLAAITVSSQHTGENNQVRSDIMPNLENMFDDANNVGLSLTVTSAYRSYSYQNNLFNNYVAQHGYEEAITFSAFPGASEHQTGLVVDIGNLNDTSKNFSSEFGQTKEGEWLASNAHKYGFILRYPEGKENITTYVYEPWHFRYVGKELATYLYENNLTLEEFFEIV